MAAKYFANGIILVHIDGDITEVKRAAELLEDYGLSAGFEFRAEEQFKDGTKSGMTYRFPYVILTKEAYRACPDCFGRDIEFRSINQKKLELPEVLPAQGRYFFSPEDLEEMKEEISSNLVKVSDLKGRIDFFKAQIKALTGQIEEIEVSNLRTSRKVETGFETRDFDCTVTLDFLTNNKYYAKVEGGEVLNWTKLSGGERDMEFEYIWPPKETEAVLKENGDIFGNSDKAE